MLSIRLFRFSGATRRLHKVQPRQYSQAATSSFREWRKASTQPNSKMAAPNKIHLTPETIGVLNVKSQTVETAAKTSELLQENHDVQRSFNLSFHLANM